jgi:hypothetical protein
MKIFDLELASPCNAKCGFCPQRFAGVKRARPFMDADLLDRITTEIGGMALRERVETVLCGMGENLLRKPLVLRALDTLQRTSHGRIGTTLVTNGSPLTLDLLEHACFQRLNAIQVSFTGLDKEVYEDLFRLRYEQVVRNVVEMNRRLPGKIYIRSIDLDRLRGQREAFVRFWGDHGIPVTFSELHSRGGHLDDPEAYPGRFRGFAGCEIFDFITFVSSDGLVLSCCHDVTSQNVVADCRTASLADIIEHKRALRRCGFQGYEICGRCTDFTMEGLGRGRPAQA